jgi:SAM-dependent methyltransferase
MAFDASFDSGYIDQASISTDGALVVDGWSISKADVPIRFVRLDYDGKEVADARVELGLPSPDVQQAFPQRSTSRDCRFRIEARVPPAIADAGHAALVTIRYADDSTLALRTETVLASNEWDRGRSFRHRYQVIAREVARFFEEDGFALGGRRVADFGCGDGVTTLGVAHATNPSVIVGFDIVETNVKGLAWKARENGVGAPLGENLLFRTSDPERIPAEDSSFDAVYSWSVFEHVRDPGAAAREIRRVLRADGALMIQIWPLYYSPHGSHLMYWFPEGFVHLLESDEVIESRLRSTVGASDELGHSVEDFRTLNRITVDELQKALLDAGFVIAKAELLSEPIRIPRPLTRIPLSSLCISGIKLLALPA